MRASIIVAAIAGSVGLSGCARPLPPRPLPAASSEAPAGAADGAPSAVAARLGELFERGMRGGDDAALTEAFREMRAVARPEELPFVDRVERFAREMRTAGDDIDALLGVAVSALVDLEKLAPDVESRLAVAHQAYALAIVAAGEKSGAAADALAIGASERLVRDRPTDPRAWSLRAHVLRRVAGDLPEASLAARRCSATHPPCAELAWQLVREIEAPRCRRIDLRPGFALHRGTREGRHDRAPREVAVGPTSMWIAEQPGIAAADIEVVVGDASAILIVLTPVAAGKLEDFRAQTAWADAAGVVFADGRVVGAASRLVPMMRGKLLLGSDPAAPLSLDALCARVVRDRAPD